MSLERELFNLMSQLRLLDPKRVEPARRSKVEAYQQLKGQYPESEVQYSAIEAAEERLKQLERFVDEAGPLGTDTSRLSNLRAEVEGMQETKKNITRLKRITADVNEMVEAFVDEVITSPKVDKMSLSSNRDSLMYQLLAGYFIQSGEMLIWGGWDGSKPLNDGGAFNPATNVWRKLEDGPAALGRSAHTAVWIERLP